MLNWKSLPGLLILSLIISAGCNRNQENNTGGAFPQENETPFTKSKDPGPRSAVYASTDSGKTWQPASAGLPDHLEATCLGKFGNELVLGTENGGLFMSENNRSAWKDISSGLATKKINTIYISGDEIYIGLYHEGVTMWKKNTPYWTSYNNHLPNRNILAIVKVKDELVIGNDMGIFKSSDHMQSWSGKNLGEKTVSLNVKGDTLFAGTVKGVMMSKDGGETWNYIHKQGAIHTTTLQDGKIFASYLSGDLYVGDNWGSSWKEITYGPRKQSYVRGMLSTHDYLLMSNDYGVFSSIPSGKKWELIYPQENYVFVGLVEDGGTLYGASRSR